MILSLILMTFVVICVQSDTNRVTSRLYSKTYFVDTLAIANFSQCQQLCKANGAELLTIDTRQEYTWIVENLLKPIGKYRAWYWLGTTPVGRDEIVSQWLNRKMIERHFWHPTSLKSRPDSDCNSLIIDLVDGQPRFYTDHCSSSHRTICQQPINYETDHLITKNVKGIENLLIVTQQLRFSCESRFNDIERSLMDITSFNVNEVEYRNKFETKLISELDSMQMVADNRTSEVSKSIVERSEMVMNTTEKILKTVDHVIENKVGRSLSELKAVQAETETKIERINETIEQSRKEYADKLDSLTTLLQNLSETVTKMQEFLLFKLN